MSSWLFSKITPKLKFFMEPLEKLRKQNRNKLTSKIRLKRKIKRKKKSSRTKENAKKNCSKSKIKYWCSPCKEEGLYQLHSRSTPGMWATGPPKAWLASQYTRSDRMLKAPTPGCKSGKVGWHRNCKITWIQGPILLPLVITHVNLRDLLLYFAVTKTRVFASSEARNKTPQVTGRKCYTFYT